MTKKIIVRPSGVEEVELTAEEVAQRDTDHSAYLAQQEAQVAADAQFATDKASAKAKLIAGEALTEAEADTIVL
jgi:hypothetical protein